MKSGKFMICIDYLSKTGKMLEYITAEGSTLEETIMEAEAMHDKDTMYLIQIMKKTGKAERHPEVKGGKLEVYEAILCKRSDGWHPNTEKYSEGRHMVKRTFTKDWECMETTF